MKKNDPSGFSKRTKHELRDLYTWVDNIPLSRMKKNISRDFSDGVLIAEMVQRFFPKLVDLHNYAGAHSVTKKTYNWQTLKRKVFSRMKFQLEDEEIRNIVASKNGYIQEVLFRLKDYVGSGKFEKIKAQKIQKKKSKSSEEQKDYDGFQEKSMELRQREMIEEKNHTISELRETVRVLRNKVKKLESLVALKDSKISALTMKIKDGFI